MLTVLSRQVMQSSTLPNFSMLYAMSSAPPPYTLHNVRAHKPAPFSKAQLLNRYLLDIIAFAYDIDYEALSNALSNAEFSRERKCNASGSTSLLSNEEQSHLLRIADATARTFDNAQRRVFSSISLSDCTLLYYEVVVPALELKVWPAYVFDWLRYYPKHLNDPKKRKQT